MNSVKINRLQLLVIVRENREKHIKEFAESVEDYKKAAINVTQRNLELANTGDIEQIAKIKGMPQKPASYEKEYDRAIRMLTLSVEDVIDLQQDIFNQLVLDEWLWKNAFVAAGSMYKSM